MLSSLCSPSLSPSALSRLRSAGEEDDLRRPHRERQGCQVNLPKKIAFKPALTPGQVPSLPLKHLGVQGAGSQVGGKEQSHSLHRTRRFRFRTTTFSSFVTTLLGRDILLCVQWIRARSTQKIGSL
eukprot:2248923-Rhodomonas_salina.1